MKVKTFRGESARAVLDQVKSVLGEDAVILNTRNFTEQGQQVCEVMAGVEKNEDQEQEAAYGGQGAVPGWEVWHQELSSLRSRIFSLLKPQIDLECLTPRQRLAMEYLEKEGVSSEILMLIWQKLQNEPEASILSILNKMVHVRPWSRQLWQQKCHALAGPHGVGKTSTVLRLALDIRKNNPDMKICLVNADLHQGKGRLFLKHYCDLSDFEYLEARGAQDWSQVAAKCREFDKVFVDLPGMSRGQDLQTWSTENGLDMLQDMCLHLVLSPVYASRQQQDFVRRFSGPKLAGLIWTKLDEACMFGDLVNIGQETGLPVTLFTHGPGLKNGMLPAREKVLWKIVFQHKLELED